MSQHILVVDDEASIRDLLKTYFEKRGYQVTIAGSAEEARAGASVPTVDLVILDVALGDEDGMELLGEFKYRWPDLPIIILTAMGFDDGLVQEALDKGASGYLSKTLPLEQLFLDVQRVLPREEEGRADERF
ncbi:MAG: response regulator [Verrucomicrobia bacterium]|nr:response regulator [Verrucomicrobiota bacterium]